MWCCHSTRYGRTDLVPRLATRGGEHAKCARYGTDALPIACESFGRLGEAGREALLELAGEAARRAMPGEGDGVGP